MSGKKRLIGAIDQGTTSTRFFLFDDCGQLIPGNQGQKQEFKQITREPGWLEHDPIVILNTVKDTMDAAMVNFSAEDIAGIGVTNQRETTVLWDKFTGEPLHNAVVWSDTRTTHLVDRLKLELDENVFKSSCGLPLANYFSAMKIRWLMDNEPKVQQAIERKRCMFGTIDTWIIWNLTGGPKSGVHVTDISNASRTMLMNLQTLKWDPRTCNKLGIPMEILPEIKPSSAFFGKIAQGPLAGVPIYGCIGDQQAATLGQLCLKPGTSKGTYGTGCFILTNTGHDILFSNHGMLTTALFQLGEDQKPFYAIEGSVASCGSVIEWLKNNLEVLPKKGGPDINEVASSVNNTGDVFFVNAFSGLFAPRWRADARGTIVGMTSATTKAHICRAVMESITFSTREVVDAMEQDSKQKLTLYKIDGGVSNSDLLAQYLADFLGIPVVRPEMRETTALGAAMAAGLAAKVWKDTSEMQEKIAGSSSYGAEFKPSIDPKIVAKRFRRWNQAVERSLGWVENEERIKQTESWLWKNLPSFIAGVAIGAILAAGLSKTISR